MLEANITSPCSSDKLTNQPHDKIPLTGLAVFRKYYLSLLRCGADGLQARKSRNEG